MSTTVLRPLEIGEILDVAIKTFTENARTLITIGAIIGVPFELLSGVVQLSTVSSADQVGPLAAFGTNTTTNSSSADFSTTAAPDYARVAGVLVTSLVGLVVTLLLTAATLKAVSDAYLGETPTVRESLRFALRRIRSLAWVYFILGVGVSFALLGFILPAIWLWVAWSMATPVLLIEDLRGRAALRRSFRLVRGRWWPTAGVQFVAFLIVGFATVVLGAVVIAVPAVVDGSSVLLAVIGSTIASTLAVAIATPLQGAVTAVLYFDLRVRKDGFDLALLAGQLGLPQTAPAPYPPVPAAASPAAQGGAPAPDAGAQPPPRGWGPLDPPGPAQE